MMIMVILYVHDELLRKKEKKNISKLLFHQHFIVFFFLSTSFFILMMPSISLLHSADYTEHSPTGFIKHLLATITGRRSMIYIKSNK